LLFVIGVLFGKSVLTNAKYLTLALHVEALEDSGIFGMQGPCLCSIQEGGENKSIVCSDFDEQ